VQRPVREAGADLAGVDELAVLVVTDQQRAGVALALALSVEPAPDDELLPVVVFDLDPGTAPPPGLVLGVQRLADDALEAGFRAGLEHGLAASLLEWRCLPRRTGQLERGELLAALAVWSLHQRVAVAPQHVERHVGDGNVLHLAPDLVLGREAHALLDLLEARPPVLVEGHD